MRWGIWMMGMMMIISCRGRKMGKRMGKEGFVYRWWYIM
jgi:hypothetical protein